MTDSSSTGRALAIMMLAAAALVVGAGMGSAATTWYPNDCGDQTIAYSWSCTEQTTIVSPAITTRGMGESEVKKIVELIDTALVQQNRKEALSQVSAEVLTLCKKFPIPN